VIECGVRVNSPPSPTIHYTSIPNTLHPSFLTEYWAVNDTLTQMGFNNKFVKIINKMCAGNILRIITAFGLSEKFETKQGLPQGSPISPILWNLFLDPLLHWINEDRDGYNLEGYMVNILAYADDIALIATNNKDMQHIVDKLQEFCWYYGLEIGADKNKKDKSIYTHNEDNKNLKIYIRHLPQMIGKPDWYGVPYEATQLPFNKPEASTLSFGAAPLLLLLLILCALHTILKEY
jgi:hypothetical protein